jgi:hypothetical protein
MTYRFQKLAAIMNRDETLYKKIALMISVENGEKIVSLSDPIKNYQKPAWKVDLNKDECIILANALLREWEHYRK